MKKNKLTYIIVFAAIIIIAMALPFHFKDNKESINQTINLSAMIISSLASIVTLWIALNLFQKYGIDSSFIEKSFSKVSELLEEINLIQFSFVSNKGSLFIKMSDPFKNADLIEKYYSEKLIFSDTYLDALENIFKISKSPFMPPEITKMLDKLQFFFIVPNISDAQINNYMHVRVMYYKEKTGAIFGRFNNKDMTVFEFLNILDEIYNSATEWLKNNSDNKIKLRR